MIDNPLEIKKQLLQKCMMYLESKRQLVKQVIDEVQEALLTETKSTAGDKHETGRAMLQLEREKAGSQLAEIQKLHQAISKISLSKITDAIGVGCVIYTSKANYFIAVPAGEISLNGQVFYAISPQAPIAKVLLSKKAGDTVRFMGQDFNIEQVI